MRNKQATFSSFFPEYEMSKGLFSEEKLYFNEKAAMAVIQYSIECQEAMYVIQFNQGYI